MLSSVTAGELVLFAIIIAMRTDLRRGEAESAGFADGKVGMASVDGGEDVVEKMPRQSSGQVDRRYVNCERYERCLCVVIEPGVIRGEMGNVSRTFTLGRGRGRKFWVDTGKAKQLDMKIWRTSAG